MTLRAPGLLPWEFKGEAGADKCVWTLQPEPPPALRRSRYWLLRLPPRSLYPAEFLALLRRHSRWPSCGVERNRWGDRPRHDLRMLPHGTLWFAGTLGERTMRGPVPANCLPYTSFRVVEWDAEKSMIVPHTSADGGDLEMARGWRAIFSQGLLQGDIRPSEELSRLLGEDSFAKAREGEPHWEPLYP